MEGERWYSIKDIVELLQVHEQTVRRWIKQGDLPAKLFGRRGGYRIRASDYEAFVEAWPNGQDSASEQGKAAARMDRADGSSWQAPNPARVREGNAASVALRA